MAATTLASWPTVAYADTSTPTAPPATSTTVKVQPKKPKPPAPAQASKKLGVKPTPPPPATRSSNYLKAPIPPKPKVSDVKRLAQPVLTSPANLHGTAGGTGTPTKALARPKPPAPTRLAVTNIKAPKPAKPVYRPRAPIAGRSLRPLLAPGASALPITTGEVSTLGSSGGTYLTEASGTLYVAGYLSVATIDPVTGAATDFVNGSGTYNVNCSTVDGTSGATTQLIGAGGIAADASNLYVPDFCGLRVIDRSTGATTTIPLGRITVDPTGVTVGPDGDVYVLIGHKVYQVDPTAGTYAIFADLGSSHMGYGLTADTEFLYVNDANPDGRAITKVDLSDGSLSTLAPTDPSLGYGNLQVAGDYIYTGAYGPSNGQDGYLRRYSKADGSWINVAGAGGVSSSSIDGTGSDAWFGAISDVTSDGTDLYVADGQLRKVTSGTALPSAQPATMRTAAAVTTGSVSSMDNTTSAEVVVAYGGYLYVNQNAASIDKISIATGAVSRLVNLADTWPTTSYCTLESTTGAGGELQNIQRMTTDGHYLFVLTDCGVVRVSMATGATSELSTDGKPFGSGDNSYALTIGPDGSLYAMSRTGIDRIDPNTGTATRIATLPLHHVGYGLTADADYLYVNDASPDGHWITKIDLSDDSVSTLVSDPSLSGGNIQSAGDYIYAGAYGASNGQDGYLRRYSKLDGTWINVAGAGGVSSSSLDGTGSDAWFGTISDVTSDGTDLYVADGQLRKVTATSALPSAQPVTMRTAAAVTTGTVSTMAGAAPSTAVVAYGGYVYANRNASSIDKISIATGAVSRLVDLDDHYPTSAFCTDEALTGAAAALTDIHRMTTDGHYLYAVTSCGIVRVSMATGATSEVSTDGKTFSSGDNSYALTIGPDGSLYTMSRTGIDRIDPNTGLANQIADLGLHHVSYGLTADASYLYVNDASPDGRAITRIDLSDDSVSTLAPTDQSLGFGNIQSAGDYLYIGAYGASNGQSGYLRRYSKLDGTWINVAGAGGVSSATPDGTGSDAWFGAISDVTSDGTDLYVADGQLRKVTPGTALPSAQPVTMRTAAAVTTGTVSTMAGAAPAAAVVAYDGYVYANRNASSIDKISIATGSVTRLADLDDHYPSSPFCTDESSAGADAALTDIRRMTTDGHYLYVLTSCGVVRVSMTTGATSELSTDGASSSGVTMGPDGYIYTQSGTGIDKVDPVNGTATRFVTLGVGHLVFGMTADGDYLYLNDLSSDGHQITRVAFADESVSTLVSDPDLAFGNIQSAGDYLYAGANGPSGAQTGYLRRYSKTDDTWINVAGAGGRSLTDVDGTGSDAWFGPIADVTSDGTNLYVADGQLRKVTPGTALPSTQPATMRTATAVTTGRVSTIDAAAPSTAVVAYGGYIYANRNAASIDKISVATGAVTRLVDLDDHFPSSAFCTDEWPTGDDAALSQIRRMTTDGHYLYVLTSCGVVRVSLSNGATSELSTDGAASNGITTGPDGSIYMISEANSVIDKVDPVNGTVSVFIDLGDQHSLYGLTADGDYLYANDLTPVDHRIEKIDLVTKAHSAMVTDDYLGYGNIQSAGDYIYAGAYEPSLQATSVLRAYKKSDQSKYDVAGLDYYPTDFNDNLRLPGPALAGQRDGNGQNALFTSIADVTSDGTSLYVADDGHLRRVSSIPMPPITPQEARIEGAPIFQTEFVATGNAASYPTGCSCADPVNTATGSFYTTASDLSVPGRGAALNVGRSYDSQLFVHNGPFGYGWTSSYSMSLQPDEAAGLVNLPDAGAVDVVQENGSHAIFIKNATGGYDAPTRMFATLIHNLDGSYTFTRKNREIFTFNSAGQLTTEADRNGNQTTLSYTGKRLDTVTDPAGRTLTFNYSDTNISSIVGPLSRTVSYGYDSAGNLTSVTDPAGHVTHYGYDSNHLLTSETDPRGHVVLANTYDDSQRVVTQTDALGHDTTFAYTGSGPVGSWTVTFTDPLDHVTVQHYTDNELTSITTAVGTADAATISYTYDPVTLGIATATDPLGHVSHYTYDSNGNRLTATDPLSHTTTNTYDTDDDVLTSTTPGNVTTTNTYDANDNPLTSSTPIGTAHQITTIAYGDPTHPDDATAVTDPNGKISHHSYDAYGNLVSSTDPLGNVSTAAYDLLGEKTSSTSPAGNVTGATPADYTTTNAYDADGRLTSVTDPLGHVSTATYDADGNKSTTTDPDSNTTSYTYDNAGHLTTTTRPDSTTLTASYDADGHLNSQTNADGKTTSYTLNDQGLTASRTDPDSRTTSYTYNLAGQPVTQTTADSKTTTNTYDNAGRLTNIDYSDTGTHDVSYSYDANGRRTKMIDGTGTSSYTYDSLGRVTTTTNGVGANTSYDYDLAGNLTSLTYPGSTGTVTRAYDADSRLTTVTDWASRAFTYTYDANSNVTGVDYPNGVNTSNSYDTADQLTSTATMNGATSLANFNNTLDGNGLATALTTSGTPQTNQTYAYNNLNQLTSATGNTLTYDSAGNLTTLEDGATQTYDDASQLQATTPTSGPVISYGYDVRGNRTTATPTGSTASTYSYDQADNLTAVGSTISYAYDGDGQRATKTVGSATNAFTYDQAAELPLILDDGTGSYVYGLGDTPLEQVNGSTPTYLHTDTIGSVRLLTDNGGTKTASFSYTAYGAPDAHVGTATTPYGYAGEYTDAETGFQYLRARYYDPATANFLTRDPLEDTTGAPYDYADGNPVANTDPTGLCLLGDGCFLGSLNPVNDYKHEWNSVRKGCSVQQSVSYGLHGTLTAVNDVLLVDSGLGAVRAAAAKLILREGSEAAAGTVGRDAATSCANSFTAITPVTMGDGTQEPISQVKVGDKVLATDPQTGKTAVEPVVQLIRHSGQHTMVRVTLADGSVLNSTDAHPIWDDTTGSFTDASKLRVGDKIESENGARILISALQAYTADLIAYNLQVGTIHTYYAGTTPVLVHNSCGGTTLYQKLDSEGNHLKYGISNNPATRYTEAELNGGRLNILATGSREDMLALERDLHSTLPVGPEEGQSQYIAVQVARGLRSPPYGN